MVCDMLRDMARRTGYAQPLELVPLQRGLMLTATSQGVLVAPVGRTPAREQSYQWVVNGARHRRRGPNHRLPFPCGC